MHPHVLVKEGRFSSLCSVLCKRQTFNSYSWHLLFLIGGGSALGWMPSAGPVCSARPRFRPGRSSEWLAEAGHGGGEEAPLKSALSMQCIDRGLRCVLLTEACFAQWPVVLSMAARGGADACPDLNPRPKRVDTL